MLLSCGCTSFSSLSNTLVQSRTGLSCDYLFIYLFFIILAVLLISVNINLGLWHRSVSQQAQLFWPLCVKNTLVLNMNKCFIYGWVNSSFTLPWLIFLFSKLYLWYNWKKQNKLSQAYHLKLQRVGITANDTEDCRNTSVWTQNKTVSFIINST